MFKYLFLKDVKFNKLMYFSVLTLKLQCIEEAHNALSKDFSSASHLFCPPDSFDWVYSSRCSFLTTLSDTLVFRSSWQCELTFLAALSLGAHQWRSTSTAGESMQERLACKPCPLVNFTICQFIPVLSFLSCLPFSMMSSWKACVAWFLDPVQHDILIQQFHLRLWI